MRASHSAETRWSRARMNKSSSTRLAASVPKPWPWCALAMVQPSSAWRRLSWSRTPRISDQAVPRDVGDSVLKPAGPARFSRGELADQCGGRSACEGRVPGLEAGHGRVGAVAGECAGVAGVEAAQQETTAVQGHVRGRGVVHDARHPERALAAWDGLRTSPVGPRRVVDEALGLVGDAAAVGAGCTLGRWGASGAARRHRAALTPRWTAEAGPRGRAVGGRSPPHSRIRPRPRPIVPVRPTASWPDSTVRSRLVGARITGSWSGPAPHPSVRSRTRQPPRSPKQAAQPGPSWCASRQSDDFTVLAVLIG